MTRALRIAARGLGRTSPNPVVGCVIVKHGQIVGEGWHRAAGTPHAEVLALRSLRDTARGSTMYVTLEPCAHQGRTPPCVNAVIDAGVAKVVIAQRDPNPLVDGRGVRSLKAAGIRVVESVLADRAARLNEGFLMRMRCGRPFVLLKQAQTIDGRVALRGRRYITSDRALAEVHRLRDRYDAVLVGVGTVLADDPQLTVRAVRGRDPLRVILDSQARTPPSSRIVTGPDPDRTLVMVGPNADPRRVERLRSTGVGVESVLTGPTGSIELDAALHMLGTRGINSVLAEPGPRLASALLDAGLVDRLLIYIAPLVAGEGVSGLGGLTVPPSLRATRIRRVGPDLAFEAELR